MQINGHLISCLNEPSLHYSKNIQCILFPTILVYSVNYFGQTDGVEDFIIFM